MKTSVIKVGDMLSVWSLDEVESRIGEVPGVESVTVNFAAENATVRYDETRVAVSGNSFASSFRAPWAWLMDRISIQWPSSIIVTRVANSHHKALESINPS